MGMICLPKLKVVKKKPKRLWLMLLVLLMNSEQSKSIPTLKKKQREHWSLKLLSLDMFNAELLKTTKDSKKLIVELRSFNSNKMKIINSDRMSDLANKLQQKIKTYKKQIEH